MLSRLTVVAVLALTAAALPAQQGTSAKPIAVSPDATRAARGEDKAIVIFEPQVNKDLIKMQGHADKVTALTFSPDGKLLASGSADKSVRLWDAATGKEIRIFNTGQPVAGIVFSGDGRTMTVADNAKTLRDYDVQTGNLLKTESAEKK